MYSLFVNCLLFLCVNCFLCQLFVFFGVNLFLMCELFLFCCANCFFLSPVVFFCLLRTLGVHLSGRPTESASSHLIFGPFFSLAPLSFFFFGTSPFFSLAPSFFREGHLNLFFSSLFFSPLAPLLCFFLLWQLFSIERTSALSSCRSCTQHVRTVVHADRRVSRSHCFAR